MTGPDDGADPFEPLDLTYLFDHPLKPPALLGGGLLYAGCLHSLYGEPGSGKTTLALWMAAGLLRRGEPVLFIDEESGPEQTVDRLRGLGVTAAQAKNLDYHPFPGRRWIGSDIDALKDRLAAIQPALVVVDSVSGLMSAARPEENSNADASHIFKRVLLSAARESGAAVVPLDHVAKGGNGGRYARGAGAKLGLVDVGLHVEAVKPFTRHEDGLLVITRRKDRRGWLALRWECRVVTSRGGPDLELTESTATTADLGPRLTPAERKLLDALQAEAPYPISAHEAVSYIVDHHGTGLRRETAARSLRVLVDLGLADRVDGKPPKWVALNPDKT